MRTRSRILLAMAAPILLVTAFAIAWVTLPSYFPCTGMIACTNDFGPNVFGRGLFTPAQTLVMALGIWGSAALLARALLPARWRWTSLGVGGFVLAVVVALTLPSIPSRDATYWCSGDVKCISMPLSMDHNLGARLLVLAAGFVVLAVGWLADRRKPSGDGDMRVPVVA